MAVSSLRSTKLQQDDNHNIKNLNKRTIQCNLH